jgi:hypothetical protein
MIRVNSASDLYSGLTTVKVVVFLRLNRYTRACSPLFPRVSNQPRVIGQKPDWLPVDLFDYIATLQFSIRSRWAVDEVSDYFTLNVGTQTQPCLNVNMKSTLAAKLWNSEVTGWWQVDGIGSATGRRTCR